MTAPVTGLEPLDNSMDGHVKLVWANPGAVTGAKIEKNPESTGWEIDYVGPLVATRNLYPNPGEPTDYRVSVLASGVYSTPVPISGVVLPYRGRDKQFGIWLNSLTDDTLKIALGASEQLDSQGWDSLTAGTRHERMGMPQARFFFSSLKTHTYNADFFLPASIPLEDGTTLSALDACDIIMTMEQDHHDLLWRGPDGAKRDRYYCIILPGTAKPRRYKGNGHRRITFTLEQIATPSVPYTT